MKVFDIIFKDLKVMFTDKKTIGIMIIMPIILTTILGVALGGMFSTDFSDDPIKIAVVKEYDIDYEKDKFLGSPKNSMFLQNMNEEQVKEMQTGMKELVEDFNIEELFFDNFLDSDGMKEVIEYQVVNLEEARELLKSESISTIIVLPEDFIYDMYVNFFSWTFRNELKIEVIGGQGNYIHNQKIEGIMSRFVQLVSTPIIGKSVFIETGIDEGIDMINLASAENLIEEMANIIEDANAKLEDENVDKQEPLSSVQYYAAAMTAMFILFTAGEGGKLLLEEKNDLTYGRMTVAGISKSRIAMGKYFTIFSFTLIQMLVMLVYSTFILKVDWGHFGLVALITICTVISIAGLGTMLAAISFKSGNYKMADAFSSVFVFLLSLIGGSFIPAEVLPKFMRSLGSYIPNGAALKAYSRVMLGSGITEILPFLLSLIVMGVIFTLVAINMLKMEGGMKYVKHNSTTTSKIEG